MPIEQIVEFKKKEEHSNLKAKMYFSFCLGMHICSLHQHVFISKYICPKVSCYFNDLFNYSEEKICVSTYSYLFITYLLIDTFTRV